MVDAWNCCMFYLFIWNAHGWMCTKNSHLECKGIFLGTTHSSLWGSLYTLQHGCYAMPLWEISCSDARGSVAPTLCVCISVNWFAELIEKVKSHLLQNWKGCDTTPFSFPNKPQACQKKKGVTFSEMRYGALCLCCWLWSCYVHMWDYAPYCWLWSWGNTEL